MKSIEFPWTETGMTNLAAYVAQLTREGVTFKIRQDRFAVAVELTGGF